MVYLTVLVTSAIVMVVGLSALLAVRVQHRAAEGANRAAEADLHARAAIELAMRRIEGDPDWRDNHTHDQWSEPIELDGSALRFKLVDAGGSNLARDPSERVWLYGRAAHGVIERTTRLLLEPRPRRAETNLLRNAGMEAGTRYWHSASDAHLRYTDAEPHSGAGALYLDPQGTDPVGVVQDVTDRIENSRTYQLDAWIHTGMPRDHYIIELYVRNDDGQEQRFGETSADKLPTRWARISATVTPQWTGTLDVAYWRVRPATGDVDYSLDDARLMRHGHAHQLVPIPRTWEQVVY